MSDYLDTGLESDRPHNRFPLPSRTLHPTGWRSPSEEAERIAESEEIEQAVLEGKLEVLDDGRLIHGPAACAGEHCPFHNPSDHHMRECPINIRYDRMCLAERICPHGVGHPDPDSVAWLKGVLDDNYHRYAIDIHGCDGCCAAPGPGQISWFADENVTMGSLGG